MFFSPNAKQFFLESKQETLWASACNLDSGGCYSFAENAAKQLKNDYVGLKQNEDRNYQPIKKASQPTDAPKEPYRNICITGCCYYRAQYILKYLKKELDLSNVDHVYLVVPPWVLVENPQATAQKMQEIISMKKDANYTISLLTAGLHNDSPDCIGLPSPFPNLPKENKEVIPENYYGLMYVRDWVISDSASHENLVKNLASFLNKYFTQVNNIALSKTVLFPTVLIINTDPNMQVLITKEAALRNITVKFIDRLSEKDYTATLKQIGEKGGVIACNGVQTLIQATILNSPFLFYANNSSNHNFLYDTLKLIPPELKQTAAVILGLSDDDTLLNNKDNVLIVHQFLQTKTQQSLEKFESAMHESTLQLSNTELPKSKVPEIKLACENTPSLNLRDFIKKIKKSPLDTAEKRLKIIIQCLKGMGEAHKNGRIMENISADNFMYNDSTGTIKIINSENLPLLNKQPNPEQFIRNNLKNFANFMHAFMWDVLLKRSEKEKESFEAVETSLSSHNSPEIPINLLEDILSKYKASIIEPGRPSMAGHFSVQQANPQKEPNVKKDQQQVTLRLGKEI